MSDPAARVVATHRTFASIPPHPSRLFIHAQWKAGARGVWGTRLVGNGAVQVIRSYRPRGGDVAPTTCRGPVSACPHETRQGVAASHGPPRG